MVLSSDLSSPHIDADVNPDEELLVSIHGHHNWVIVSLNFELSPRDIAGWY